MKATITREEAIERLQQNKAAAEFYAGITQNTNLIENELKDIEAFDVAIKALSAETSTDLISRADAIEAVCGNCEGENYPKCDQAKWCNEVKALLALPSAEAVQGK